MVVLMYVTILSLMKLQNYIVWRMMLHFLKLIVVSLFHMLFFNCVIEYFFEYCLKATTRL